MGKWLAANAELSTTGAANFAASASAAAARTWRRNTVRASRRGTRKAGRWPQAVSGRRFSWWDWRARARWAIENVDATAGVFEDYSDDEIIDGPGA